MESIDSESSMIRAYENSPALMRSQEDQDASIEGLRGFAALLVVLNHLLVATAGIGVSSQRFGVDGIVRVCVGHLGAFGVQLFFCITGYLFWKKTVVSARATDWAAFYRNRILRVAPAYLLSAVLVMLFAGHMSQWNLNLIPSEMAHDAFAMLSLGLIPQHRFNGMDVTFLNAVTWTLQYEWLFYALLPMAVAVRSKRWTTRAGMLFLLAYIFAYEPIRYPALFFVSGAIAAEMRLSGAKQPFLGSIAFCAIAAFFIAVPYEAISKSAGLASHSDYLATIAQVAFAWPVTTAAFFMVVRFQPSVLTFWPIRKLGTISYSLYLLHLIVMQATVRFANAIRPASEWTSWHFSAWAVVAFGVSLATAAASYMLVEKPFLRLKRRDIATSKTVSHPEISA